MKSQRSALVQLLPLGLVFCAVAAVVLFVEGDPGRLHLAQSWQPPGGERLLGSGDAGVDLSLLAAHATFRALVLALAVACFGFVVGTSLGASAGLAGGARERWALRVCDLVQSFPTFLLALAVLSAVRVPSRLHIGLVFCISAWAPFARLALAQTRSLREAQFVEAARALGASRFRVVFGHVVPNLLGPVAVQIGTAAAGVVIGETALGFVGLGPPDGVSLGGLLEQGTLGMLRAPHVLLVGALTVLCVSGSLQLASEGLRRHITRDAG
ncbi:MAG: ABC transporter permease [Polyangiaceae bacterium]|nr:ABC transporter permease [Polyangiaceae bacterium]